MKKVAILIGFLLTALACAMPSVATPESNTPATETPVIATSTAAAEPTKTNAPAAETATLTAAAPTFELPLRNLEQVLAMVQPATPNRSDCESDKGAPVLLIPSRDMEYVYLLSDSPCPKVRFPGANGASNYFDWAEPLGKLDVPVQIPNTHYMSHPWVTIIESVDGLYGIRWSHKNIVGIGLEKRSEPSKDESYWLLVP